MAPGQTRYSRKLSAVERFSLGVNEFVKFNADIFVEGDSTLTAETLRAAVEQAGQANPGCRVRLKGMLGFTRWADCGIAPQVREISAPGWDGRSLAGAPFMEERLDALAGGPVCEVIHVPGNPTRIIFRSLHAAFDASAVFHFAAEIFRALRGEALQGSPCTYTDWDAMRPFQDKVNMKGMESFTRLNAAKDETGAAGAKKSAKTYLPVITPGPARAPGLRYLWRSAVFPTVIPNALAKAAIYLADYARRGASGEIAFNVPVDLRQRRVNVLSLGNLTNTLQVSVQPGDTARSFTRDLGRQLANHVDCYQPRAIRLLSWIPLRVIRLAIRAMEPWLYEMRPGAVTGGVTSVGPLARQSYSAPGFACSEIVPVPAFAGKLNLVIATSDRHTVVSVVVPERYNSEGQFDALMDAITRDFGAAGRA